MRLHGLVVLSLLWIFVTAPAARQQPLPCETNFASRGSTLSGRTFTNWQDFPALDAARVVTLTPTFIREHSTHLLRMGPGPEAGSMRVLRGEREERAVETTIRTTPLATGGVRVTVEDHFPRLMVVTTNSAREAGCAYFAFLAAAPVRSVVSARNATTIASTHAVEEGVVAPGLRYGDTVAGTMVSMDQIDRFQLRDARRADTVVVVAPQKAAVLEASPAFVTVRVRDAGTRRTLDGLPDAGPVVLGGSGPYELLIEAREAAALPQSYALVVHRHTMAPDHVSARIAVGETVTGESIDYVGDQDEFALDAVAGQEIQLVITGENGNVPVARLYERLPRPDPVRGRFRVVNDVAGILRIPRTGTYSVVVGGVGLGSSDYSGPYTLRVRSRN